MPEESPHPLLVWPIQEVIARMTLGVSFTFLAVRINATTEVTEDSIPCTTPPNIRCQSQLGGGMIHCEGNRIDSMPIPDWLAHHRNKIKGERSESRSVGKECVSTVRTRGTTYT